MRKYLLTFVLGLMPLCFFAQGSTDDKEKLYVDYFSSSSNISKTLVKALRNKVIEGIHEMNRVVLIDVDSDEVLKKEAKRRASESAMGDATARSESMTTLGAGYLLQGQIISMTTSKEKDSEGKIYYKGSVAYTLKVIDASNGTLKGTQTFEHKGFTGGRGNTSEEAILKTLDYVKINMGDFVDEQFKMEGTIVQSGEVSKQKVKTVYIDLGKNKGVLERQKFLVYEEVDIAGEISRQEIGQLNVKEVLSAGRSLCKVSKGGEEIFDALQRGATLIVVSRPQTFFGDLF